MNDNKSISQISYKQASGEIPFNMTNDYMFRVILQKYITVLKALTLLQNQQYTSAF